MVQIYLPGWVGWVGGYTVIIGLVLVQIGLNLTGLELSLAKRLIVYKTWDLGIQDPEVGFTK